MLAFIDMLTLQKQNIENMSRKFKTIGIIGKTADPGTDQAIHRISNHLQQQGIAVLVDETAAKNIPDTDIKTASRDILGEKCDLIIVVGGDGTMLGAALTFCDHAVPVVGVNLGRLGFLVDISPSDAEEKIDEILNGEYQMEERSLLNATVIRDGKKIIQGSALNDIVVHKWDVAHMIETNTYIDDHFVHKHRSDGIITSTPTGSTAYALSGGGPIIHPGLESFVIVPICPHTLSNRPIAVKSSSKVRIVLSETSRNKGQVTCDGRLLHELELGDEVLIETRSTKLHLLHPKGYDYYQILRAKLHWAEHP